MAARRLIFVMIVLLLASSIAAALVPIPEGVRDQATTTTAPTATLSGDLLEQTLRADAAKLRRIRTQVGDQLALTVTGSRHDLVEIAGLGRLEDLAPGSPARFNLLFEEPGTYTVRLVEVGRAIGQIEVMPRNGRMLESPAPQAPARRQA